MRRRGGKEDAIGGEQLIAVLQDELRLEDRGAQDVDPRQAQRAPLDELLDDELLALAGHAMLKRGHDVAMFELGHDFPFGGLVQARETGIELGGLDLVQHFETNGSAGVAVAGAPDLGHAPLPDPAEQVEALVEVTPRVDRQHARHTQVVQRVLHGLPRPPPASARGSPAVEVGVAGTGVGVGETRPTGMPRRGSRK